MKKQIPFISTLFRSIFLVLNLLAIIWLLACKWASFYNPNGQPTFFSLFSLTTAFAFIANVFFVFYWLFTRKKIRSLYSLVLIILLWGMVHPLVGFAFFRDNRLSPEDGDLKVMTWNVHMFDLGAWANDETAKAKIINLINEEDPDILCLEEFYVDKADKNLPYTEIIRSLGYPYVGFSKQYAMPKRRIAIHASKKDKIIIGNVIFSKFPLDNVRSYELGVGDYSMLSADAEIDSNHKLTVNVVHLTSVRFGAKDMAYIDTVQQKGLDGQNAHKSKFLLSKLCYAAAHRSILANHIDSLKRFMNYPMIICGDFNDVPSSYVYEKVKGDLEDPFPYFGLGFGRTYRNIFPTLRIDYIFYDADVLNVIGYGRRLESLSDHFPVIANFRFKDNIPSN